MSLITISIPPTYFDNDPLFSIIWSRIFVLPLNISVYLGQFSCDTSFSIISGSLKTSIQVIFRFYMIVILSNTRESPSINNTRSCIFFKVTFILQFLFVITFVALIFIHSEN